MLDTLGRGQTSPQVSSQWINGLQRWISKNGKERKIWFKWLGRKDSNPSYRKLPPILPGGDHWQCWVSECHHPVTQASSDIPRDAEAGSQISQDSLSVISGNVRFLSETETRARVDIWPLIHCDEGCWHGWGSLAPGNIDTGKQKSSLYDCQANDVKKSRVKRDQFPVWYLSLWLPEVPMPSGSSRLSWCARQTCRGFFAAPLLGLRAKSWPGPVTQPLSRLKTVSRNPCRTWWQQNDDWPAGEQT